MREREAHPNHPETVRLHQEISIITFTGYTEGLAPAVAVRRGSQGLLKTRCFYGINVVKGKKTKGGKKGRMQNVPQPDVLIPHTRLPFLPHKRRETTAGLCLPG